MLSIDEVIAKHRKIAKTQKALYDACTLKERNKHFLREAEEHEQLAEWLEDYKRIKMLIPIEQALKNEYNKAIDDFLREIKIDVIATTFGLRICDAERIAEQLKAGVKE